MLSERISDGAFVAANKLDFCYTNWEFSFELFSNLTNQPSQKLKLKIKTQKLKIQSKKSKVESQKLKVKSCKSLRVSIVLSHNVYMYCVGKAEKKRRWLRILKSKLVRACVRANLAFGIWNFD